MVTHFIIFCSIITRGLVTQKFNFAFKSYGIFLNQKEVMDYIDTIINPPLATDTLVNIDNFYKVTEEELNYWHFGNTNSDIEAKEDKVYSIDLLDDVIAKLDSKLTTNRMYLTSSVTFNYDDNLFTVSLTDNNSTYVLIVEEDNITNSLGAYAIEEINNLISDIKSYNL